MSDLWLPGAQRIASSHAGGSMAGGPPRAVWHRTAGGSFDSNATFLRTEGYEPHLLWDPNSGQVGQYLPADRSAYALAHPPGMPETNRAGAVCIQIEVVDHGQTWDITDTPMVGLDGILSWLDGWGIPRDWPLGGPSALSGPRAGGSAAVWLGSAGHYGHCHVPGNDHVDPGCIDLSKFTHRTQEDVVAPEDIEKVAQRAAELVRKDLATLLHGTKDGSHPANLDNIWRAVQR